MDESVFSLALCSCDEDSFDEIYDALDDDSRDDEYEAREPSDDILEADGDFYSERYGDW